VSDTRQAAELVAARLDELVEAWVAAMWAEPDYASWARDDLREVARANAERDIGREVDCLLDGCTLPTSCPEEVAASARLAASLAFPQGGVLQGYRTGHALQWKAWQEAVYALERPQSETRALLELGSDFLFEYADRCCRWAARAYAEERERLLRSEEQRRTQLVRGLLAGEELDAGDLGYELDGPHLGVIAWGPDAEEALDALAAALDAPLLRVAVDRTAAWAWLGAERWAGGQEQALRRFVPPGGVRLAVAGPAADLEGFRRVHDEAAQAHRMALRGVEPLTRYDDVALLALAAQDEERARGFRDHELGPLAAHGEREQILRETLRAYLGAAQNASSAAALLGVHERTVANRIRTIEERLGLPVASRSAELDVALRLHELLVQDP
jgi:PucR C-terminal helix-turn-helix domain/GGDEF-like domain